MKLTIGWSELTHQLHILKGYMEKLSSLQSLVLYSSYLDVNGAYEFGEKISNLKDLKTIKLDFWLEDPDDRLVELFLRLKDLSNLQQLYLKTSLGLHFCKYYQNIYNTLSELKNLRWFIMQEDSTLDDEALIQLALAIKTWKSLELLEIEFSFARNLEKEVLISLAESLISKPLKSLHLKLYIGGDQSGFSLLQERINQLTTLRELSISIRSNELSCNDPLYFITESLINLDILGLNCFNCDLRTLQLITESLQKLTRLTSLCLRITKTQDIKDSSLLNLSKGIRELKRLKYFDFKMPVVISKETFIHFKDTLKCLRNLIRVHLNIKGDALGKNISLADLHIPYAIFDIGGF